jgi:spermidine synthase
VSGSAKRNFNSTGIGESSSVAKWSLGGIYGLFLASGATALVYQVAWSRSLSLVFGASFEAISIVLASFMGGLAAGGFILGRVGGRLGRPLRVYAALELGVAFFAMALPWLLQRVDDVYLSIALEIEGTSATLNAARIAMAFSVLLLPTFCMGGTLPILMREFVRHPGKFREGLAGLYAINTIGAVLGALTAGFVLLPTIGVWHTQLAAALTNVAIGFGALVIDRFSPPIFATGGTDSKTDVQSHMDEIEPLVAGTEPESRSSFWPYRLAFWGTAVAGLASLVLEVAWSRAIVIASGANTYSFTIMLATFLTGIAIGSWMVHQRAPRRPGSSVSTEFGVLFVMIGVSSLIVSRLLPRLSEIALLLKVHVLGGAAGISADTTFVLSFLVMLVPCIMMGIAFPLAGEARARLDLRLGESVGDLVGLNTLGAIIGSLLAGFVLIPQLGLQATTQLASFAYLAYGSLVLIVDWGARNARLRGPVWAAAICLSLALFSLGLFVPRADSDRLFALPNNDHGLVLNEDGGIDFALGLDRSDLLYAREGRGSTVSVIDAGGVRSLLINGKAVATDDVSDVEHEYLLGHLPVLLHPDPKSALVIGLGAGLTMGGVVAHDSLEEVVVVEIEPAVQGGAQFFADLHDDGLSDPRLELVWQDGRNYLRTTNRRFDVITADPIHPWAQGAAYLYTTEYYGYVAAHLEPGGIACQWLPMAELSADDLRSVVASFLLNFEYATLWQATGDLLLIGSDTPLGVDLTQLEERLRAPRVARQLERAGLAEPLSLLTELAMDRAGMERFSSGMLINTDDNLYLEFSSPMSIGSNPARHLEMINGFRENPSFLVRDGDGGFGTTPELDARLHGFGLAKSLILENAPRWHQLMAAPTLAGMAELITIYQRALELAPGYAHAEFLLAYCHSLLGEIQLRDQNAATAMISFYRALDFDSGNAIANVHVGMDLANAGDPESSLPHFEAAHERAPTMVEAVAAAGQVLMSLGRFEAALERLDHAAKLRPDLAEIERLRCLSFRGLESFDAAIEACRRARELAPESARVSLSLANTLHDAGRSIDAIAALRTANKLGPVLRQRLSWFLATSRDPSARDGAEAIRMIAPIARTSDDPRVLEVFAAALAEAGRFEEATRIATRAAEIAETHALGEVATAIRGHAALFAEGRPIRD